MTMQTTSSDIVVIGHGISALTAAKAASKGGAHTVTMVTCNDFLELPFAAAYFLANPAVHRRYVCGDPSTWHVKGIDYITGVVDKVDLQAKTVSFVGSSSPPLSYGALIVASGMKLPLFAPEPGATLLQRAKEVISAGTAIARAKTVLVNGSGLIGLEIAGDIRAQNVAARVVVLSRDGGVLKQSHGPAMQAHVLSVLQTKLRIEVMAGSVAPPTDPLTPSLEPGVARIQLADGSIKELEYDVYLPSFMQGPNTAFLSSAPPGTLDSRGRIIVNEFYQSEAFPSLFATASVSDKPVVTHPVSVRSTAVGIHTGLSAQAFLDGAALPPFKDTLQPPAGNKPINIKLGHGPNGYMIWDGLGDTPLGIPCCQPCHGGFPFCPPPCCWGLHPALAHCLGECGGPPEGPGPAYIMDLLLPKFGQDKGYIGYGNVPPPVAAVMDRAAGIAKAEKPTA